MQELAQFIDKGLCLGCEIVLLGDLNKHRY